MHASLKAIVAPTQIAYMFVTPFLAWTLYGVAGVGIWIVFTGMWVGASVVIWSAYQEWRADKHDLGEFLLCLLLSPLLGTAWSIAAMALVVRYGLLLAMAPRRDEASSR
jgi:hypothetical protein